MRASCLDMRPIILSLTLAGMLAAGNSAFAAANPLGLFFDDSFDNIESFEHPGGLVVTGNCNRYDERFAKVRAAGGEVLAYLNPIEIYDTLPCKLNRGFYNGGNVALWPFPGYGERTNWPKTKLADIRAGTEWSNHIVEYIAGLMREGKVDGVFLDNIGAQLWARAKWNSWAPDEKKAWTLGNVDLVRRIDEQRRKLNPRFIVVTNNFWDKGGPEGLEGERYVDGIMLEHSAFNQFHRDYAQRAFADRGQRRVLVMAKTPDDVAGWAQSPGVTHVGWQPKYDHPPRPSIPFAKPVR